MAADAGVRVPPVRLLAGLQVAVELHRDEHLAARYLRQPGGVEHLCVDRADHPAGAAVEGGVELGGGLTLAPGAVEAELVDHRECLRVTGTFAGRAAVAPGLDRAEVGAKLRDHVRRVPLAVAGIRGADGNHPRRRRQTVERALREKDACLRARDVGHPRRRARMRRNALELLEVGAGRVPRRRAVVVACLRPDPLEVVVPADRRRPRVRSGVVE